ncbi:MAG: EAL domain-containing protein, partial [Myxococcota bacterium]
REACREAASWPNPLSISVNLSPVDFRRGDIAALLLSTLLETGLDPQRLEVEITEGVLIDDFDRAIATLRRIKNLGVRVAIDDFGTGFSVLSHLKSLPVDVLKIDRGFVADLGSNTNDLAIVRAVIALAEAFELELVAEGVETRAAAMTLLRHGCHRAQGFLLSPALDGDDMASLLAKGRVPVHFSATPTL